MDNFCRSDGKILSRQEIWLQRQTIESIEKHLDKSRELREEVRLRVEATEKRLIERHREVRMMEGYVDRLKTDAFKAFVNAEQLELDDIALTRHKKRTPS
jgi:flagellar biosynthesis chaperone FliJ